VVFPNPLEQLKTVATRHFDVAKNDVCLRLREKRDGFPNGKRRVYFGDPQPVPLQGRLELLYKGPVIIYNQDGICHSFLCLLTGRGIGSAGAFHHFTVKGPVNFRRRDNPAPP
jgi:hypothetical protein